MKAHILYVFLILISQSIFASKPVQLDDNHDLETLKGAYCDYLIDPDHQFTINEVASPRFRNRFISFKNEDAAFITGAACWMKAEIRVDSKISKGYVIELYDFQIDSLELYLPQQDGSYRTYRAGYLLPFKAKEYKHKNFVFNFPYQSGIAQTIYIRIVSSRPVSTVGVIRSFQQFAEYSNSEYFYLALFYGIVGAMVLYNAFLFISLADITYLFYVLYVLSLTILALSKDGLGFQYIWHKHPSWNHYIPPIANYALIISALWYARSFLDTRRNVPRIDKGIIVLMILKTILVCACFLFPFLSHVIYPDLITMIYIYFAGIMTWASGHKMARFYVLAFTLFFTGFLISNLQMLDLLKGKIFAVYALNWGTLAEMILLSLALADRIRVVTQEKENAQREILIQLQEKQVLKDNLNKELEEKINERTRELDTLIYRSSHEIKGPLKSIIGLSSVGIKDFTDPKAKAFFDHIHKSSKKLDKIMGHLLLVTSIKEARVQITHIDLEKVIGSILENLLNHPSTPHIRTEVDIQQQQALFTDQKLLYGIIKNILECSLKFRDFGKTKHFIQIKAEVNKDWLLLQITNHGAEIDPDTRNQLYNLLNNADHAASHRTGSLYIAKVYVEKLAGTLKVESQPQQGTTFYVKLKNNTESPIPVR